MSRRKNAKVFDIKQNTSGTIKYLKQMLDGWSGKAQKASLALASYYKGYTGVKTTGALDPATQTYVKDIFKSYTDILNIHKQYQISQTD